MCFLSCPSQQYSEQASDLFNEAYGYAPDSFKQMMHDEAVAQGLISDKPDAYRLNALKRATAD